MNKIYHKIGLVVAMVLMIMSLAPNSVTTADSTAVQPDQGSGQVIIFAMPYDFPEYSFWTADSYATAQWISATAAGLYKRSAAADGEFVTDLAAGDPYNPTDDTSGLTKIVQLQEDLRFWNGAPLTIDDVVFSYKAALTAPVDPVSYGFLVQYFDSNDSISIESRADNTIRFEFSRPYAFWQGLLTVSIVQQDAYQERYDECLAGNAAACDWNADDGSDANSAGPFYVEELDLTNMVVTVTKNPFYYDAADTWASQIIYQKIENKDAAVSALAAGDIDIMDAQYVPSVNEFLGLDNIDDPTIGDPSSQEVSLNHKHPAWGTGDYLPGYEAGTQQANRSAVNVRKAMSHILDRAGFVSQILEGVGEAASTVMPSASLGHLSASELPPRDYDILKAREYMRNAGYSGTAIDDTNDPQTKCDVNVEDDCAFEITVLSPNTNPARNQWSAAFVNELPKIGIGVTQHVSASWGDITPRTFGYTGEGDPGLYDDGGYDLFFVGYSWALDWNPSSLYSESGLCSTGGGCNNFYNYVNKTIEQLIFDYTSELDFTARTQAVADLQRGIHADIPVLPIVYPQSHWGWRSNVQGIDALLISTSNQEWELVRKTEWSTPYQTTGVVQDDPDAGGDITQTGTTVIEPVALAPIIASIAVIAVLSTAIRKKRS